MSIDRDSLRQIPSIPGENKCFGCGPENPYGLNMFFFTDEKALYSWVTISEHACGWENVVHGGILSTLLDEIMNWTVIYFKKQLSMTKEITLNFNKAVLLNKGEIRVESRIEQSLNKREVMVQGQIFQNNNDLCVSAKGTFNLVSLKTIRRLDLIEEKYLGSFQKLLSEL